MLFDLQRALLKLYDQKKYNELIASLLPLAIIALGLLCLLLIKVSHSVWPFIGVFGGIFLLFKYRIYLNSQPTRIYNDITGYLGELIRLKENWMEESYTQSIHSYDIAELRYQSDGTAEVSFYKADKLCKISVHKDDLDFPGDLKLVVEEKILELSDQQKTRIKQSFDGKASDWMLTPNVEEALTDYLEYINSRPSWKKISLKRQLKLTDFRYSPDEFLAEVTGVSDADFFPKTSYRIVAVSKTNNEGDTGNV
ncbi:hypothetical protein LGW66_00280 [Streptococcus mutans]|nr:hypothetical protein [Streptococcus mutans]